MRMKGFAHKKGRHQVVGIVEQYVVELGGRLQAGEYGIIYFVPSLEQALQSASSINAPEASKIGCLLHTSVIPLMEFPAALMKYIYIDWKI